MKRNILLLFTFFACITVQGQTPVRLVDLRSEHLDRPIGLDNPVPRLSWRMEDGRQGAVQTSWRIVVDEDSLNVVNGCGRMWDSGKNDSRNQLVAYAGKKLQPFTRYYWKVICSDMEYKETASPVSYFETGMMGMQHWQGAWIGDGITAENAEEFLTAGASHVIVTSYVFCDGKIQMDRLKKLRNAVGKEHLVLDLSCRKKDGKYYIVTDRWQRFTEQMITEDLLEQLAGYCDEFLVHAVDVEGKASGIEEELVRLLGSWGKIPVTYAGGVGDFEDLARLKKLGKNMLNVTIGSALDLFGGTMSYEKVKEFCRE